VKVEIRYRCTYSYSHPVGFSPHLLRLFPKPERHLQVHSHHFATNPGALVHFRRDLFDNEVARCFYPEPRDHLLISLDLDLEVRERNPFEFLVDPRAALYPFSYSPPELRALAPYLAPLAPPEASPFSLQAGDTAAALVELNAEIHGALRYERRDEGPPLPPAATLARGAGACRDFALLFCSLLRRGGIASRFASGYLIEAGSEDKKAEGAMHMWVEAFLPGAGWIGLDPTNGYLCNHCHIAAAVGADPDDVTPVLGGIASDAPATTTMNFDLDVRPHA
jgi:transglutaminase-like putative cysteine protease